MVEDSLCLSLFVRYAYRYSFVNSLLKSVKYQFDVLLMIPVGDSRWRYKLEDLVKKGHSGLKIPK